MTLATGDPQPFPDVREPRILALLLECRIHDVDAKREVVDCLVDPGEGVVEVVQSDVNGGDFERVGLPARPPRLELGQDRLRFGATARLGEYATDEVTTTRAAGRRRAAEQSDDIDPGWGVSGPSVPGTRTPWNAIYQVSFVVKSTGQKATYTLAYSCQ